MVNTFVLGMVLASRVTFLLTMPCLPSLLKVTFIKPSSPGATGSLEYSGTVHPQLALADVIMSGDLPAFLNLKLYETFSP